MEHSDKKGKAGAFLSGAVVATLIGGYLLFGSKNAKRNREKVENWMEDAKDEVASKLKKVKRLTREKYDEIVDTVSDQYAKLKEVGKEKADSLREELKRRWDEVEEEARRRTESGE